MLETSHAYSADEPAEQQTAVRGRAAWARRRRPPSTCPVYTGQRADSEVRSIVFRALRLCGELLRRPEHRGLRGVGTARLLVSGPLARAWDRRVGDIEGVLDIAERLVKSGDLTAVCAEATMQAALCRLNAVCPQLFVRVNRAAYLIPFGQLRSGQRVTALDQWCRGAETALYGRKDRDSATSSNTQYSEELHPGSRSNASASDFPGSAPGSGEADGAALVAALVALERLGVASQGHRDNRAFVAACIGEDFGLSADQWWPHLVGWADRCDPPFPIDELEKKLASARRNRRRPWGYRASDAPCPVAPASRLRTTDAGVCVWDAGVQCGGSPAGWGAITRWAEARGLDPQELARRDLVRFLPASATPATCRIEGQSWGDAGYQVLLPVYDVSGIVTTARARQIDDAPIPDAKEILPRGQRGVGLVFADESGVALLRGDTEAITEVWIVEGGPNFLTIAAPAWALEAGRLVGPVPPRPGRAILGIFSGSWTAEHARRIPVGVRVVIVTDPDAAGDAYARRVSATLWQHHEVVRLVLPSDHDANKAHRSGVLDLTKFASVSVEPEKAHTPTHASDGTVTRVSVEPEKAGTPTHASDGTVTRGWDASAHALLTLWPHTWAGSVRELARSCAN